MLLLYNCNMVIVNEEVKSIGQASEENQWQAPKRYVHTNYTNMNIFTYNIDVCYVCILCNNQLIKMCTTKCI